ncbi:MAG: hypothetical protein DWQ01_21715 [Planctomycetota bacterium]|nr:MAG: hypothetical protein DWQ01_21715 [Planctomycetota bacterium]
MHLLLALLLPCLQGPGEVSPPQEGPFLLQNVHLWHPDGNRLNQSLWIEHGLVQRMVGPDRPLPIPPEAKIIEAEEDWWVYPGLIHGNGPARWFAEEAAHPYRFQTTDPKADPIPAMEWGERRNLRGWYRVADDLDWDPQSAKSWHRQGFTSTYLLPAQGLVRGRAAWVSWNSRPLGEALLQRDGAMTLSLRSVRAGYPRTPMASLALLRQALLDAERQDRVEKNSRQKDDPDWQALQQEPDRPWLFLANSTREIENALDLMRDFGNGRRIIVVGGAQAWQLADRLRESQTAVLFRLDLDDPPASGKTEANAEETDEAAEEKSSREYWKEPERQLAERKRQHQEKVLAFSRLRQAGVRCALIPSQQSQDLADDLKQLAEAGMSPDTLLQALGPDLADILDLPQSGWIQPGHAADFFVHRGPWKPGETDLAWLFADGRAWHFAAKAKKEEPSGEGSQSIAGTWSFETDSPMGPITMLVEVDPEMGTIKIARAEAPGDQMVAEEPRFEEQGFRFRFMPPDLGFEIRFEAEVEGDQATADLILPDPAGRLKIKGKRIPMPRHKDDLAFMAEEVWHGHAHGHSHHQEPEAEDETGNPSSAAETDKQADPDFLPKGHPQWPVETAADRLPGVVLAGDVLLQGGKLYPMDGNEPFSGDLLIREGRIWAVADHIDPEKLDFGVPVLDVQGMHLIPGIIDPHSHLALDAINEGSVSITAECRIEDMIHPGSLSIYRAAAGGCAVVQSLHGSANPIGGQAAVWELDHTRTSIADLLVPGAKRGIKFALGENVKQSNWGSNGNRFPISRSGVEAVFRRAFVAAQDYKEERRRFEEGSHPSFRRDVRLEVLADILDNKIHVQIHSYRADEILMFLGLCAEFGVQAPTFQHVLEGYKVAPELAAYGAMASTFSDWWAYKFEVKDAIPWNPYLMNKAGVVTTINSDSNEMIRRLNAEAAKGVRYGGMSDAEALALCTLNGAKQLHVENRLGSLEVGKDGTVTVFDGPPLSSWSRCRLTLARGRVLYDWRASQDEKWQNYQEEVQAFAALHRAPAVAPADATEETVEDEAWSNWIRPGQGLSYFIYNAVVHPIQGPVFRGQVLVQDGRFQFVGEDFARVLPKNCIKIDAQGRHLYPGFLNGGDQTGLFEIATVAGSIDHRETGMDHPDLSIATAIHPDSVHHRVHRMNGITHVLSHATSGRISGQVALIQLDGETPEEMAVVPDLALHVRFPRVPRGKPGEAPQQPKGLDSLNRWFDQAEAYESKRQRFVKAGQSMTGRDLKLEAMLPYARGEKPILVEANDVLTLARAHQWVQEKDLQAIYFGAQDGWKIAGLLGATGARVITGPVHSLPGSRFDPYDSRYRNPSVLAAAGCQVALRTENPEITRNLPFQAATAGVFGWGREQALYALTLGAAEVLGVDRFTGSIEVGKAANFFLSSGDPLDFTGSVERLWIGGREVELQSWQSQLRDRYEARIDRKRDQR